MQYNDPLEAILQTHESVYAPYSKFPVGASLLAKSGEIFTGCNVENVSLGLTICAEWVAGAAAVAAGEKEFVDLAVVTSFHEPVFPYGACRQVLAEFDPYLEIVTSATTDPYQDSFALGIASGLAPENTLSQRDV